MFDEENVRHQPSRQHEEQIHAKSAETRQISIGSEMTHQDHDDCQPAPPIKSRDVTRLIRFTGDGWRHALDSQGYSNQSTIPQLS
ncbi:hypothetical protein [Rhizobium sp. BR 362]|uniref:hypothetical protein n=1 Tax=Rhizobium sp. BR 362 TaxID=3040670 RepID=UPI002F3E3399